MIKKFDLEGEPSEGVNRAPVTLAGDVLSGEVHVVAISRCVSARESRTDMANDAVIAADLRGSEAEDPVGAQVLAHDQGEDPGPVTTVNIGARSLGAIARVTMTPGAVVTINSLDFIRAGLAMVAGDHGGQVVNLVKAIEVPPDSVISSIRLVVRSESISFTRTTYDGLRRGITDLTRRMLSPAVSFEGGLEGLLRSLMIRAAEQCRSEFLATGDVGVVEVFARNWLGFSMTGRYRDSMLEAVLNVLLDPPWASAVDVFAVGHTQLRGELRGLTEAAHRGWKPVTECQINGHRVGALNEPVVLPGGEQVDLLDILPGHYDVEAEISQRLDPRKSLFNQLSGVDADVAWQVLQGLSWPQAAIAAGQQASEGRNVTRRIQRRAQELVARERARDRTAGL